jgi:hypothetical protein
MSNEQKQPREFDAVLGGDSPIITDAVLGGIKGINRRLSSTNIESQITALQEAFNYGDKGLDLVIDALEHKSVKVQRFAAKLLQKLGHKKVKLALEKYKFWSKFEKYYKIPCNYATTFANRKIIEFDPKIGIHDTVDIAYALRVSSGTYTDNLEKLQILLQSPLINQVEALVFGTWYTNCLDIVDLLLNAQDKLTNIKALFIGDVNRSKLHLAPVLYHNLSYILLAYPQLEILKFRCDNCYKPYDDLLKITLDPVKHENLKALIIESNSIGNEFIYNFYQLELPTLEYLELWLGLDIYDRYPLDDLIINFSTIFPKLKYLGLHKHHESDNLAFAIANSPIVENLVELDLSVGAMHDIDVEALFNCPAIRQLDTLDISHNYINYEMIEKMNKIDINLICKSNRTYDFRYYPLNE